MGRSQSDKQPDRIETEKNQILDLVAQGYPRRLAAEVVGWSVARLRLAAAADPHFNWHLAHRELAWEITVVQTIQRAARSGRHPAAAAWLKKRNLPLDTLPNRQRRRLEALGDPPPRPSRKPRNPPQ